MIVIAYCSLILLAIIYILWFNKYNAEKYEKAEDFYDEYIFDERTLND